MKDIVRDSTHKIYFILDNHSTNKNFVVLAYMDYLVSLQLLLIVLNIINIKYLNRWDAGVSLAMMAT